jgi:hypothetical protein
MPFSRFNWVVAIAALLAIFSSAEGKHLRKRQDGHWVDTWASMPQLTEPTNLPPAPYVSPPRLQLTGKAERSSEPKWLRLCKFDNPPDDTHLNWRGQDQDSYF